MGQQLGKRNIVPNARPFINLRKKSVELLWESFNDIADGFGLTRNEFVEICQILEKALRRKRSEMKDLSNLLFDELDTDKNELVDALEFLSTVALVSGMEIRDKIYFAFMCYDFDESDALTIDEMTLALKSAVTGLAKFSKDDPPLEVEIERFSEEAFFKAKIAKDKKLPKRKFVEFCEACPEIRSYIMSYDDPPEETSTQLLNESDDFVSDEISKVPERTEIVTSQIDPSRSAWLHVSMEEEKKRTGADDFEYKSWVQKLLPPTNPSPVVHDCPSSSVELEWIYGYQAQQSRKNLLYTADAEILWPAATVAVVQNVDEHRQRFYMDAGERISCVTMHPSGDIFACGTYGSVPEVLVWNSRTMKTLQVHRGFHKRGIRRVAFSPDGMQLLTIGLDPDHSVAVYEWETNRVLFTSSCGSLPVLDAVFRDNTTFVTCGVDHLHFWGPDPVGKYRQRSAHFGRKGQAQTIMCVDTMGEGDMLVSGTKSGHVYLWADRSCVAAIHGHDGHVTNIAVLNSKRFITGGTKGKIRQWRIQEQQIEIGPTFDINSFKPYNSIITSLAVGPKGRKYLVGTRGGEAYEVHAKEGTNLHRGPVVGGHSHGELHAVACHPERQECCTVGDDGRLCVWDLKTHMIVKETKLKAGGRCVAYSPDGSFIACGLGIGKTGAYEGMVVVYNESDLTLIYDRKEQKRTITDIRFSPTGTMMAVASADRTICVYNVLDSEFFPKTKCRGHTRPIAHMDFDTTGTKLRSASIPDGNELYYWDANTGEVIKSAAAMRDIEWETSTVPFSWAGVGAFGHLPDGTIINCSASSQQTPKVLVVGDNYGRIGMMTTPQPARDAPVKYSLGHGLNVRNVRFSRDDHHLVSCGQDCCLFQWKFRKGPRTPDSKYAPEYDSEDEDTFAEAEQYARTKYEEDALNDNFASLYDYEDRTGAGSDRFKAVKPWSQEVVPPTQTFVEDSTAPSDGLTLNWVHGIRTRDIRGSLRYTATGEMLYTVAHLAVVMNREHRRQRYFVRHTDDIISLALDKSRRIVATGQVGKIPTIWLWNATNQEALIKLEGLHRCGVSNLAFSNSGLLLASAGVEKEHQIGVWNWRLGKLLASKKCGHRKKVLDLSWGPHDDFFVQAGVDHVRFHYLRGRNLITHNPNLISGKFEGTLQPFVCIGWAGSIPVVGTHDGHLYQFNPENNFELSKVVQAHSSTVNTMYTVKDWGICTGGKDGTIKLFNPDLECSKTFDVGALGTSVKASIRSVLWDPENRTILCSTRGSDIYELSALDGTDINGGPIIAGHSADELWGLACHPSRVEFVTAGDDMTLRVWEAKNKLCLRSTTLPCMARCVAYHPNGKKIAVGLGADLGKGKHKKSGTFMVFNASDLDEVIHEGKDSKQWLTDIKYSPDGNTLAVASQDNQIYLYDVSNGYMNRGVFSKHNSFITHFDFSADSAFMRSNCGAYELLFSDASNGSHMPVASVLRDQKWETNTCVLGWPVQGLWPKAEEVLQTDIHSCDSSKSGTLLVTSDAYGMLTLRKFPCLLQSSSYKTYRGHSLHVRNVRFTAGDKYVISVGGRDRCVFQWEVTLDGEDNLATEAGNSGDDSDIVDSDEEEASKTDDFVAVKPWLGSIVPPTNAPTKSVTGPDVSLTLDYVHGYRSQDARCNVCYNHVGNVLYPTAALGIIYDKTYHGQRFFSGHRGDIVSLTIDKSGKFAASGEIGKRPTLHIWDATTALPICEFSVFHRHAIVSLAFSRDSKKLVSIGNDENHVVTVWSTHSGTWEDGQLQAYAMGGRAKTIFSTFNLPQANFEVLTGGVNHVNFWRLRGRSMTSHKGFFGKKGKIQPLVSGAVIRSHFVTGTVSGHLYVWDQITRTVSRSIKAHSKSIDAMFEAETEAGHFLLTGSKDGVIKVWNHNLICQKAFDINDASPTPRVASIRSVSMNRFGNTVLIGTKGSEVYEVSNILATASVTKTLLVSQGHYGKDQLWGLDPHPLDADIFATTGDDATLRIWSISKRRIERELSLETVSRCVCWSPDGKTIGVGLGGLTRRGRSKKDGAFLIIDASTLTIQFEGRDSREYITDCKYSPDGRIFAVASRDSKIYLYDPNDAYMLKAKCEKHSSHITHFDFSSNSAYIQSNDGAYELIFYNSADGQQLLSASSVKDEEWHSPTCVLSWPLQGAWPEVYDGNEINAAHRSNSKKFVAIVDRFGQIKILKYPCLDKRAKFVAGYGVAANASCVRWTKDDRHLVVLGGTDRSILVWRVEDLMKSGLPKNGSATHTESTKRAERK